jgi:hypothetical protein
MIVEERIYTLYPGKTAEYVKAYTEIGMKPQVAILGRLLGWFTSEIGELNQIVHMWGYDSYEERVTRRAKLMQDPDFQRYLGAVRPLIVKQENKILIPTPFSPMK